LENIPIFDENLFLETNVGDTQQLLQVDVYYDKHGLDGAFCVVFDDAFGDLFVQ